MILLSSDQAAIRVTVIQPTFCCENEVHPLKVKFACSVSDLYFTSAPFNRKAEEAIMLIRGSGTKLLMLSAQGTS
jgi:hypothetical protein